MVEYINRDALLQEIEQERRASKNSFPRQYFVVGDVLNCIRTAPAADVVEVRHGHWIGEIDDRDGHIWMECSECHKVRVLGEYCSSCGALMDKEDEHEAS